jgi:hypothetical protein|tara:strand:+ start:2486 stop:3409 length:924 start_codon:yes stop_codon:yes gene_type:complete
MSDYVIVSANAGLSGNFLMRLLNFSRAIEWQQDKARSKDIVSKIADDQYINYCWTSQCHEAVMATSHKLAHHWYMQSRTELDRDTWYAIKKASARPSAWFFHKVDKEVRNDVETIIVAVEPGNDFDIPMYIDRRCFNGSPEHWNETFKNSDAWFRYCLTSIKTSMRLNHDQFVKNADIVIKNRDIFDVVKVLELMKELGLYHNGLRELITDWIKVYLLKNKRPEAIFSKSQPEEYRYKEQVDRIVDPHIRHFLMCVNRKSWPTLDLIDDPYAYMINFRKDLLAGERFDVAFNRAEASFQDWKSQIDS